MAERAIHHSSFVLDRLPLSELKPFTIKQLGVSMFMFKNA